MKILVMPKPGEINIEDYNIPEIRDDEVLVKVVAAGLCTWEQKFYFGKASGFPFVGGHEISGLVQQVGSKVSQKLNINDKVVVASLTRCGECYYCRRGYDNQCQNVINEDKLDGYQGPGGFAEYIVAKGYEIYKMDQNIDSVNGVLAEPLACVTHSLNISQVKSGDYVFISGGGLMGLLHVLLAIKRGARVIVSEPNEFRRNKAMEFGALQTINPMEKNISAEIKRITDGRGVEIAIYTAGGKNAIESSIDALAIRGTLVVYGTTGSNDILSIDPKLLHYKEINLTGVTKHTKDTFRTAVEHISDSSLPIQQLLGPFMPYTQVKEAFEKTKDQTSFRVVILF